MIIKKIRDFFLDCPVIDEFAKINVDYLGARATEYTIDSVPATDVVKQYVDGSAIKQFVFVFGSREYYGSDVLQNLENSGFYEQFSKWLDDQSRSGSLPKLEGKKALKIEATTSGYLFDASEEDARYQIQCRLLYFEK